MPDGKSTSDKHVVLAGAGHAHVEVLRRFGAHPLPGVRLTLVTPGVHTPYSGMLPGLIAGHYTFDQAHINTAALSAYAGARLVLASVRSVDSHARTLVCDNGVSMSFDILSLDTGSTPSTGSVPGAAEHAIPVKPIDRFLPVFEALIERARQAGWNRRIAVVGGGAGGVELILALAHRLRREARLSRSNGSGPSFLLVTAEAELLTSFPARMRHRFLQIMMERGIAVFTAARVVRVAADRIELETGDEIAADEVLWVTEAQAPGWLRNTDLPLDERGFLKVDAHLQVEGAAGIFAAGDMIAFTPQPVPKSGVYAVRAGPVLDRNIRSALAGQPLGRFRPQRNALYLITTGARHALGARNGIVFEGDWVWRFKDWIDRRFMARYKRLAPATLHEK
jgi:selenide,water dikinase